MAKPVNVEITLRSVKGNQDRLLKRFMKKVKKERIIEEIKDRRHYEKPSAKRRRLNKRKKENARKANAERNRKLNINT
jgi:ribosomal protein S21